MLSRYAIFCAVVEQGSFTKAAAQLGYSQSAVSQAVRSLEGEIGASLVDRQAKGLKLTPDGAAYYPYIRSVVGAERALEQKRREMEGLENSTVRMGTFTSVSRTLLPPLMKGFKETYPDVSFVLRQGDYPAIASWINESSVDLGFVNSAWGNIPLETKELYQEKLVAVLPPDHHLAGQQEVTLAQLAKEPFILLDEGERSVVLEGFSRLGLTPGIAYEVCDDYTILAMVRLGLGVSMIYQRTLQGFEQGLALRPVADGPGRTIALAWRSWSTVPYAARRFAEFLIKKFQPVRL